MMVVVVGIVTVVVASEPPRLCKPGEWSDNAATRFTVLSLFLYHPFVFPLFTLGLSHALSRPLSYHLQLSGLPRVLPPPPPVVLFLSCHPRARARASLSRLCRVAFPNGCIHLEGNPREAIISVKRARMKGWVQHGETEEGNNVH